MEKNKEENITQLNTYSIDHTLQNIRQAKRKKLVRRRTSAILIGGLFLVALAAMPLVKNYQATEEFYTVHAQSIDELEVVEEKQSELEYQVKLLEDEEYIAKLARQELNLSKPHEILINLPEKEETETEEKVEESKEKDKDEEEKSLMND